MIRRIIYISQSLISANPDGLGAIVFTSIRHNAEADVTGMLWADEANFAQVIEGDPEGVGLTMDRIRNDHRHTDIHVLLDRTVSSRQFGNWSMRLADGDEACTHSTTFMIGFAMGERSAAAKRLRNIILASDGRST